MFDALKLAGREMCPDKVMDVIRKDKAYYANSGGGLTLSGGEPLLHPEFCAELFAAARDEGIHTAIDTAANVPYESLAAVLPYTCAVLLDLKIMDAASHEKYTGSPNGQILENARRLFGEKVDLFVRIPLIAGVNDTRENAEQTVRFLRAASNLKEVKLLPYHGLGVDKAQSADMRQEIFAPPDEGTLNELAGFFLPYCLVQKG
jgi:pyruvate formate lyase activating enzyme